MYDDHWPGTKWATSVLYSEKNPTMDKKLIITVCPNGADFSRIHNPNQPYSPVEIAQQVIDSYREGASIAHLHNRDDKGTPMTTTEALKETVDIILDQCPDIVIQPSSCQGHDPQEQQYSYLSVKPMVDNLHKLNKQYMESTIFTPVSYACENNDGTVDITFPTEDNAVKTVSYLQENGIKPEFMAHNFEGILNVKEWLIKPGILKKPYYIAMGPGMHNSAETYPDPWGTLYVLTMMKMMPEDTVIEISAGGRNWLGVTAFAILMGVDSVRVGMEDHLWMYPHKDEKIKSSADEVRKVATIAKELGRDIATPSETRAILGIR